MLCAKSHLSAGAGGCQRAAAPVMKLIAPRILAKLGYRKVLVVNTLK
jgi:hypothetical protein